MGKNYIKFNVSFGVKKKIAGLKLNTKLDMYPNWAKFFWGVVGFGGVSEWRKKAVGLLIGFFGDFEFT